MQLCTSLQTDNHSSTPPLSFLHMHNKFSKDWACSGDMLADRQIITRISIQDHWMVCHSLVHHIHYSSNNRCLGQCPGCLQWRLKGWLSRGRSQLWQQGILELVITWVNQVKLRLQVVAVIFLNVRFHVTVSFCIAGLLCWSNFGLGCASKEIFPGLLNMFFSGLMPSVLWCCWLGSRKGIRPVKYWAVGCWYGYLAGARCRLAYGPADATATHCLLLQ